MKELACLAIDTVRSRGATYGDIRIIYDRSQTVATRNGQVSSIGKEETLGFGIRVIANGSWGFAYSSKINKDEIARVAKQAVDIAVASSKVMKDPVKLAPEPAYETRWQSPYIINPFDVRDETKLDMLMKIDEILRKNKKIVAAETFMDFIEETQYFMSTEGSWIIQNLLRSGAGYSATAVGNNDQQERSFTPVFKQTGYEMIGNIGLLEKAERVREEAVELLTCPDLPNGKKTLIITGDQLALQIHESVGHATELDRVLGFEANYAGRSFATPEKMGNFIYGSNIVNIVADATLPTGLGTYGFDDDGVAAQRWHIIQNGILQSYMINRETAPMIGLNRSKGANRAEGFRHIPITRMTNLSLLPGDWEVDDMIKETKDGILMDKNRCWSIDQHRLNFQFGVEYAYEIKNGKKGKVFKNANYQGITPHFWATCDAIAKEKYWVPIGVPNCGKGQPGQRAEMSHGCSFARFKNVEVGVSIKGAKNKEI